MTTATSMYERIKRLYESGRITAEAVIRMAEGGLITMEQAYEIIGGNSDE